MKKKDNYLRSVKSILTALIFTLSTTLTFGQTISSADGYAGYAGTTGGGSASKVTVSTASDFEDAVDNDNSKVIVVSGRIDLDGDVKVGSNTTIVGANTSSGLYGGTLKLQGTNYIIQNLTFGPSDGDLVEIRGATNVFITKCTFHDSSDELCSVVRQADYVTISWSKFYFDDPDDHSYAHLIGNSDNLTDDAGKLNVTLHHNWYYNGVKGRQPRVRFGKVHIYNCYYNSNNTDYCIGAGKDCHIRIENTHFDNIGSKAWTDYGASDSDGEVGWNNVEIDGASTPSWISNSYPVFSVPYSYSLTSVGNVESVVKAGAGNVTSDDDDDDDDSDLSYYHMMNRNSEMYVALETSSTSDDVDIIQTDGQIGYWSQQWAINDLGTGYFQIVSRRSGKCMRAVDGNVQQYQCYDDYWTEMFTREAAEDEYYIYKNRSTGTCLRVENSSSSSGASIVLDDCDVSYWSQQFSLVTLKSAVEPVDESPEVSSELYSIFPTRTQDMVYVNLPEDYSNQAQLLIYTHTGARVTNATLTKEYVDMSTFNSGLYLIVIKENDKSYTHKIIKQ